MSRLCLGTMTFGLQSDEATGFAIMDKAAEGGVDFFDTSDAYPLGGDLSTRGRTEEIIGRWLRGKRDRFIVATKCFVPTGPSPIDGGNSRKHIMSAVDASLRRLQTDYIDLYQLHGYDRSTPIDETLGALDDLVHSGQGPLHRLLELPDLPAGAGDRPDRDAAAGPVRLGPAPLQPAVPADRAGDAAVLRRGRRRRDLLQPDRGRAAVRASTTAPRRPPEGSRFTLGNAGPMYQERYWHEREFETVEALRKLADQAGVQPRHAVGRVGARQQGDHRADHRGQPPEQLDAASPPRSTRSTPTSRGTWTTSPTSTGSATPPAEAWPFRPAAGPAGALASSRHCRPLSRPICRV